VSFKRLAYSAVRATTLSYSLRFILQLLQIAILARLLRPAEFGLMAVAGSFLAVLSILTDFGISRTLLHFRDISDEARSSLFWINILLALGLGSLMLLASPLIATVYSEPIFIPILTLCALVFPLSALGQQLRVLSEKDLHFKTIAWIEIFSTFIGLILSVFMAIKGFGVYTLVGGLLVTAGCSSALIWIYLADGWRPALRLRLSEVQPYLRFGAYLAGEKVANALSAEADVFIGGVVVGPAALGPYAVSRNIALRLANTVVNPVVTRVGLPVMAHVQHDQEKLRSIYLTMLRMVSSINFPIYILLSIFADEVVVLLYGPGWEQATDFLRVLAIWGLMRSIGNPVGSLIVAAGHARRAFWWNVTFLIFTPPLLFMSMSLGGLYGLTWSLLMVQILVFVLAWRVLVFPICGAGFAEYCIQLLPAFMISVFAGVLAMLSVQSIGGVLVKFCFGAAIYISTYLALSLFFNKPWVTAMRRLLKWQPI
jgi:lipopolysaccharide exporter